jgi:hypothetical protein
MANWGLADPAQPVHCLRLGLHDRGRLAGVQALVELVEQVGAAGEGGVVGWQVRHQWAAMSGRVEPVQQGRRRQSALRGRAGGLLPRTLPDGEASGSYQQGKDCPSAPAVVGPQPTWPPGGVASRKRHRDPQRAGRQRTDGDQGSGGARRARGPALERSGRRYRRLA